MHKGKEGQPRNAAAPDPYWQVDEAAGLAVWFCLVLVVFFDVDCPLQSLALPPSFDAPLPLFDAPPLSLLFAPPVPLLLFEPLDEFAPPDELDPLLLPDC